MNLSLREVNAKDIDLLYQWANDKTVRQNAFHTEQIPYADHRMWFTRNLADRDVLMYILCQVSEMGATWTDQIVNRRKSGIDQLYNRRKQKRTGTWNPHGSYGRGKTER